MERPRTRCLLFAPKTHGPTPVFGLELVERTVLALLRAGVRDFLVLGDLGNHASIYLFLFLKKGSQQAIVGQDDLSSGHPCRIFVDGFQAIHSKRKSLSARYRPAKFQHLPAVVQTQTLQTGLQSNPVINVFGSPQFGP